MGKRPRTMNAFSLLVFVTLIVAVKCVFAVENEEAADKSAEKEVRLEFRLVCEDPSHRTVDIVNRKTGKKMHVLKKESLSNKDVARVQVVPDWYMDPEVAIFFTREGKRKLAGITQNNIGRRMAIVLNGEIITAPSIRSRIASGQLVIAGEFDEGEVDDLVEAFDKGDGVVIGSGRIHYDLVPNKVQTLY